MKYRITLYTLIIAGMLMLGLPALAQNDAKVDPGILPDSPLYFLEVAFENIATFFTFDDEAKAQRLLVLLEERVAEVEALAEQGSDKISRATDRYQSQLQQALERLESAREKGLNVSDTQQQIAENTERHLEKLDAVIEKVPEQAREAVQQAKEMSKRGQAAALNAVVNKDIERGALLFGQLSERKLNKIEQMVEEADAEGAEAAVDELEEFSSFGKHISQLAQGLESDESTVAELIEAARTKRVEVLKRVKEKAPQQAQEAINRALNSSQSIPAPVQDVGFQRGVPTDVSEQGVSESERGEAMQEQATQRAPEAREQRADNESEGPEVETEDALDNGSAVSSESPAGERVPDVERGR